MASVKAVLDPRSSAQRRGTPSARPAERVRQFIEAQAAIGQPGARLPTVRDISSQLGVSPTTVHAVFRKLAREGRIESQVGNGTFLRQAHAGASLGRSGVQRIGVCVSRQVLSVSPWCNSLTNALVLAAAKLDWPAVLVPLELSVDQKTITPPEGRNRVERSVVDGLIVVSPQSAHLQAWIAQCPSTPIVTTDQPSLTSTADFVCADYAGGAQRLGQAWRESGRQRVALWCSRPLVQSSSESLRLMGLQRGLGMNVPVQLLETTRGSGDFYRQLYNQALQLLGKSDTRPDAIYCTGDLMAMEVLRAARDCGISVPDDLSLVGGTGLDLHGTLCPSLTRFHQPFDRIAAQLLDLLRRRLSANGLSLPGVFVPVDWVGGATTPQQENDLIGIAR